MIRRFFNRIAEEFRDYRSLYYSKWALKQYNAKRYDALHQKLSTFSRYRWVSLGEYPLLFFIIGRKQGYSDQNNPECLRKFLGGIKYREQALYDEDNPLKMNPVQFAYMSWQPQLINALKEFGANPYIRNGSEQNLLHLAAMGNKELLFKQALKEGVDMDAQDKYQNTPIHYAARAANHNILKMLVGEGAKKDLLNVEEKYPIHMAVESQDINSVALLQDSIDALKYEHFRPLHLAAALPDIHIVRFLLQHNHSHVFALDKDGMTPLHYSVMYTVRLPSGNQLANLKQILLNNPQINKGDRYGNTALHLAVLENKVECAKALIECGANPLAKNVDKLTPVDCAFTIRSQQLLRHFRQLGIQELEEQYFTPRM